MKFKASLALSLAAAALLSACAGTYGPGAFTQGAGLADVTRAMGTPTGQYTLSSAARRLEFARGPYGKHTYMLDFDNSDRLVSWQQVLDESHFNGVRSGMTRDEVLMNIGRPSEQSLLPVQARTLWSYRYDSPFCQWFQVSVDTAGKVVDTGYGPDPMCIDKEFGL
jgi:outer membrane protein assembly factor BamE (lipoprotein component of BamABCDE complex)